MTLISYIDSFGTTNVQLEQTYHEDHAKRKKLADGRISLYIESFKGSTVDEKTGKSVHLRDFEFLKLYLHPNPNPPAKKRTTKTHYNLPKIFWHSARVSFLQGRYGFKNKSKANRPFLDYYVEKMEEKSDSVKNYGVWESACYHLKNCVNPNLLFDETEDNFVKRVWDYFEKEAGRKPTSRSPRIPNIPTSASSRLV